MFHTERALMNKLLVLVFETMSVNSIAVARLPFANVKCRIPPTVVMLILVSWTSVTGSGLSKSLSANFP